ncbi:hypothetical protein GCM10022231_18160 [Gordonia caeni]|uniref:PET hydrolase/cutinase-like domain-containing protein n=1 Tax=Gordonia caeni TaxID=1007097 RepID=A0ABP7P388_9ACTN
MLRRILVPVTAALTALTLLIPVPVQAAGDWAGQAPFTPQVRIDLVHTVYYPREMGRDGLRHPVVLWGNGTGAIPGVYSGLLRHYARQGFVVVAANTPTSNFAISMRWGIDLMERENADPRSVFFRKVDLGRIAAAGHSQGGSAAINAALDKRVSTVVAMAPGPLNDPALVRDASILYLAGEHDPIVWPALVRAMYRRSGHLPAGYLEMRGASHLEAVPSGGSMRAPSTAWLRYWLFDDDRAGRAFFGEHCGYCVDRSVVTVFERNRAAQRSTAR